MLQGENGCRLKYKQATATMDYSFLALQFLSFQCIQRVPYIVLHCGNGRSNLSDLKANGRPRDKWLGSTTRKTRKHLAFCTHPDVRILGVISAYIHEKGIKSCIQQIMSVFRDDLGNNKNTKIVHGVQSVYRGTWNVIKVWSTMCGKINYNTFLSNAI